MTAAASLCLFTAFETMLQMQAHRVATTNQFSGMQRHSFHGQRQKARADKDPLIANLVSLQVRLMEEELTKTDLQEDLQSSLVSVLQCAELQEVCNPVSKQLVAICLSPARRHMVCTACSP